MPVKGPLREDAEQWLTARLAQLDMADEGSASEALCASIRAERPALQVALLKACVDRLPALRAQQGEDPSAYRLGSVLYTAACWLYGEKLPYDEDDICELLRTSKHDCGHGGDVVAPLDLAIDHARRFGLSRRLFEALGGYVDALTGLQSSKAQTVKRRAALLFVLDSEGAQGGSRPPCWSDGFRLGLASLPPHERVLWHELVLQMKVGEQPRFPNTWRKVSAKFVQAIGAAQITRRFTEWWPTERPAPWPLESGGSQLLRHFVWTLHAMRGSVSPEERQGFDDLVRRLAFVDWKPRERAKKVAVAAASYLVECSPAVAAEALQRLSHWSTALKYSDWEPNRVAEMARKFANTHALDTGAFAIPHAVTTPAQSVTPALVVSPPSVSYTPMVTVAPDPRPPEPRREGWLERIRGALRRAFRR